MIKKTFLTANSKEWRKYMSSKKTILLDGVKKGQLISWFATTQAANTNTVKLYDDKTTYFENSKATVNMVPPLAQGYAVVEGDNLSIDVTTSGNCEWKLNHSMLDLTTDVGKCIGKTFSLVGEDSVDNDFNDICISISAWNKTR